MQAAVVRPSSDIPALGGPRYSLARILVLAGAAIAVATIVQFGGRLGLETHETGSFRFDAPSAWTVREAVIPFTGGSSQAVVGTVPIPRSCGLENVDINCYYAQRLPPASVSIVLLNSSPFTAADTLALARSEGTRLEVGGYEAYRFVHDINATDYYRSDAAASWLVVRPASTGSFWVIEARVRGPGADELVRDVERVVRSMRFGP